MAAPYGHGGYPPQQAYAAHPQPQMAYAAHPHPSYSQQQLGPHGSVAHSSSYSGVGPPPSAGPQASRSGQGRSVGPGTLAAEAAKRKENEVPEFPPGMEYLRHVDRLFVHQEFELLECLFCLETNNQYLVQNANSQIAFRAEEDTNFWQRCLCCSNRGFQLAIYDGSERQVLTMRREIMCCTANCCWRSKRQRVEMYDMENRHIGSIQQDLSCLVPTFLLVETVPTGEEIVLKLRGPRCMGLSCCSTAEFAIFQERDDGDRKVGDLSKKYGGCFRECCTDADEWSINFPMAMPITHKALVLSACFFLDYLYYENGSLKDMVTCHF